MGGVFACHACVTIVRMTLMRASCMRDNRLVSVKDVVNNYKLMLESNYTCINDGEYDSFKRYLKTQLKETGYEFYSPTKTVESMCYNPLVFTDKCLLHVYNCISKQTSKGYKFLRTRTCNGKETSKIISYKY